MNTIIPIPIPINAGEPHPLTNQEVAVLIGILLVLTIVWLVGLFLIYLKYKKDTRPHLGGLSFYQWFDSTDSFAFMLLHFFVLLVWATIIIVSLGNLLADYIVTLL